ncbi:hypothetical protein OQA88_4305 [Cercophora sp. LCS_1]
MRFTSPRTVLAGLLLASSGASASRHGKGKHDDQKDACAILAKSLPGDMISLANTQSYNVSNTYWSQRQSEIHPACFVYPSTAADVSTIVKTLTLIDAPFTVKSGGHTAFAGSNLWSGVTIDLARLNTLALYPNHTRVYVGAGNRWINVTRFLEPMGLAVVGGRVSDVGVSGLVLGGGISYFSGIHGWACDNVHSYEVVLASGDIVHASSTRNSDLYWALRGGGGSNLGIVTRFELATVPLAGPIWANTILLPGAVNTTLLPLFQNLTVNGLPSDPGAHTYLTLINLPSLGGYVYYTDQVHVSPTTQNATTVPAVFQGIDKIPSLSRTPRMTNLTTLMDGIEQPYGDRQTWWNTAVKATDAQLLVDILPLHEAHVSRIAAGAGGTTFVPYLTLQPIPVNVLAAMQKRGGNALGLNVTDGPLIIVQSATSWQSREIDSAVVASSKQFIDDVNALAKSRGLDHGFVYMNYAERSQDVFGSYGAENLKRLRDAAKKWDPKGQLQELWKGYFKFS